MKKEHYIFVVALEEELDKHIFNIFPNNILLTGVGKVNAAFELTRYLTTNLILKKYENIRVINIGTAGWIDNKKLAHNNYLLCNRCYFHDVNLTSFGYKIGQLAGKDTPKFYSTSQKLNQDIQKCLGDLGIKYEDVNIATGDQFIQNTNNIENIISLIDKSIQIVDMEVTSLAYVCNRLNIEFSSIKVISDIVSDTDNKESYIEFCKNKKINILKIMKYFLG